MVVTLPDADLDGILGHPLVAALLSCSSDGAVVIDAATHEIVQVNDRARELLGIDGASVEGCRCDSVLASDAYFPFGDAIALAAERGVTAIIQPGGSIRDEMAIEIADRHHLAMVFTGRRHFRH